MPKVGKKHFSYSEAGKEKAKAYAEETGQSVEYQIGGPVTDALKRSKKYQEGGKNKKY